MLIVSVLTGCSGHLPETDSGSGLVRKGAASDTVTKAQLRKVQSELRDLRRRVAASSSRPQPEPPEPRAEKLNALIQDVEQLKARSNGGGSSGPADELTAIEARLVKLEQAANKEPADEKPPGTDPAALEQKLSSMLNLEMSKVRKRLASVENSHQEANASSAAFKEEIHKEIVFLTDKLITIYAALQKLENTQAKGPSPR